MHFIVTAACFIVILFLGVYLNYMLRFYIEAKHYLNFSSANIRNLGDKFEADNIDSQLLPVVEKRTDHIVFLITVFGYLIAGSFAITAFSAFNIHSTLANFIIAGATAYAGFVTWQTRSMASEINVICQYYDTLLSIYNDNKDALKDPNS